jgi:rhodanese-related sulfurtransferase
MVVKQRVDHGDAPRITQDEANRLLEQGKAIFVDLRAPVFYEMFRLPGAIRLDLKDVVKHAESAPPDKTIVYYCDCPNEETSARAVQLVRKRSSVPAVAFVGTVEEWLDAGYPFERSEPVRA